MGGVGPRAGRVSGSGRGRDAPPAVTPRPGLSGPCSGLAALCTQCCVSCPGLCRAPHRGAPSGKRSLLTSLPSLVLAEVSERIGESRGPGGLGAHCAHRGRAGKDHLGTESGERQNTTAGVPKLRCKPARRVLKKKQQLFEDDYLN